VIVLNNSHTTALPRFWAGTLTRFFSLDAGRHAVLSFVPGVGGKRGCAFSWSLLRGKNLYDTALNASTKPLIASNSRKNVFGLHLNTLNSIAFYLRSESLSIYKTLDILQQLRLAGHSWNEKG
jgi:hypothetical protein